MTLSLLVPAYSYPSPTTFWDGLIAAAPAVKMAVANAASGPGTTVDANYAAIIAETKMAGIRVLGYVDTDFGPSHPGVPIATVEANIDLWRTLYGVTDIFFDEVSALLTDVPYYTTAAAYVRTRTAGAYVVLNHGAVPDQSYALVGDTLVTFEGDATAYASYAPAAWVTNGTYPVEKFANIVYNSSSANLPAAILKADSTGAGYVYFTDDVLPNPYDTLPTYFAAETASSDAAVISSTNLLNLRGVGVRADGFIYELLDANHNPIGTLDVSEDSAPTITNDTTRTTFRTCSSLLVAASDLSAINPLKDRLQISIRLQNGDTFPLGVFMFGTDTRAPYSWGTVWTPELFDETFILHQQLDTTVSLAPGQSILALINELIVPVGLPSVDFSMVQDQLLPAGVTAGFSAGDYRDAAINSLIKILGYFPPYFNNPGTYTTKAAPPPNATATLTYGAGGRIIDGSTQTTNSVYSAPNRYEVVGSSAGVAGFVGIYDLPASAPNSFANTGIRVTSVQQPPGVPSAAVAATMAYIAALTDTNSYVQANFSSTADPRHDTFDLVSLLGVTFQETGWSLVCSSGGTMTHTLAAYYSVT